LARRDGVRELKPYDFVAEQEHVLDPGDLVYLPPHWAHEGVAVGSDCMSCSIGMRAPQRAPPAAELVQRMAETHDDPVLYRVVASTRGRARARFTRGSRREPCG
jgi:50S ribosomal protein L16 3-hydroxylase